MRNSYLLLSEISSGLTLPKVNIQIITGRGEKYARGMMGWIRKKFKKDAEPVDHRRGVLYLQRLDQRRGREKALLIGKVQNKA